MSACDRFKESSISDFANYFIVHYTNVLLKPLIGVRNMHLIVLGKENLVMSLDSESPIFNIERLGRDNYLDTLQQELAALHI
ncbi:hypothetical protein SNOG_08623 [Parastagonospora nodorum SN15]|uniref:Uncharacterized protein n=1 Tax=Phaeosphaeria nodorum (strain SN15 / ATCC MYA-4574 / FGSC 10173) TaxID=321614 RepID=Q0UHZ1_PHANO|nr:hypothetical protein SNOG_08623 [Parastagonospora nodorum SN15]EAT83791.1 hypothetical protein SNOG_08623 [Parastagonospora nodorum SN15]